jgi:hypothetical protein
VAGSVHLNELGALQSLNLGNTKITDGGLAGLKVSSGLKWLKLGGTKTTEAAQKTLERALPNLNVVPYSTKWRRHSVRPVATPTLE